MIYTLDGTPLTEALPVARLQYAEWMQRHIPKCAILELKEL